MSYKYKITAGQDLMDHTRNTSGQKTGDGDQDMDEKQQRQVRQEFGEAVNMTPEELERWLETDESKSVGEGDGESKGHRSGRRIVDILHASQGDLKEQDYEHMRKVTGYVHRHLAQKPSGDPSDTPWRYSLMNWGHDPLKS